MDKKETLIFNKVEIEGFPSIGQVVEKMYQKMYNDRKGLGFTNITIEDNMVFATILLRTPSYIRSYNEKEGMFEQQVVNIYGDFEIAVDIEHGLIFCTSSSTKFSRAKTLLRDCFEKKISFQNIEMTAVNMLNIIQCQGMTPYIMDLSIKRYRCQEGAIGRCSVHIEDSSVGEELLLKYSDSINKITFLVKSEIYPDFVLSIASQNSFTIKCDENFYWQIINQLKKNL